MKFFGLLVLTLFCFASYVKSEKNCSLLTYKSCFLALATGKAEDVCNDKGACTDDLMDDFDDCLDTLYDKKSYSSVELILINGLKTVYTSLSFGCDKAGGEWCFDYYRRSLTNLTDFNCSKCGNVVLKKYKRLLKSFQDENSEDYKETKKQIEAMELCGALANASIKISSIVIVALASLFFIF